MRLLEAPVTSFSFGAQDSASAVAFRPGEASAIWNMRISPEGTAEVRYGSRKAHSAALNSGAQCYGAWVFTTAAGVVQWVAAFGDSLYYSTDEGATWTLISAGLREDYWSGATMRVGSTNYLLLANGGANGKKWDGASLSNIANLPSGVTALAVFNERLWCAGHSGNLVQASRVGTVETWTGSYSVTVQVQTHDGDNKVLGLYQVGPVLLAFKRNSTNVIDGFGQTDLVVSAGARGVSRSVGCIAPRTVQAAGDAGCMWLSDRGIEFYQPGAGIRNVSASVRGFFESIAWGDIIANPNGPTAVFLPNPGRHEYLCALPSAGNQNNVNVRVHLSLPTPEGGFAITFDTYGASAGGTLYVDANGELSFSSSADRQLARTVAGELTLATGTEAGLFAEISASTGELGLLTTDYDAAALFAADRGGSENAAPCCGSYDGYVRYLEKGSADNQSTTGTGGVAIAATLTGPPSLFGAPATEKWGRVVEAMVTAPEATTVTLALIADGTEVDTQSVSVAGAVNQKPVRVRSRVSGKGETLQAELRASLAGLRVALLSPWAEKRRRRL